jgi:PDZ domain-containing protein
VVIAAVIGLGLWHLNEYALTPGDATPVAPLVTIHGLPTDHQHDTIYLTDVYLTQLTAWQWLTMHFQSHVQFVPGAELVDPGVPADELNAQGYLEMNDSKQAASVAAFRSLGWTVPATASGAVITAVVAPSPARTAGLKVADEVVGVNGASVDSMCSLIGAVHDVAPKTVLHLQVKAASISASGDITWRAPHSVLVTTEAPPSGTSSLACPRVKGPSKSFIGVELEDGVTYQLPATVSIDTANIGGPSAGLAMTLTLIDQLSHGTLTGHHVIAATGTMDPSGDVGDVGGVAEKTVAVANAGAKYFFVPEVEVSAARSAHEPELKIIGVTSLDQVLRDLRAIGGVTPTPITTPH